MQRDDEFTRGKQNYTWRKRKQNWPIKLKSNSHGTLRTRKQKTSVASVGRFRKQRNIINSNLITKSKRNLWKSLKFIR